MNKSFQGQHNSHIIDSTQNNPGPLDKTVVHQPRKIFTDEQDLQSPKPKRNKTLPNPSSPESPESPQRLSPGKLQKVAKKYLANSPNGRELQGLSQGIPSNLSVFTKEHANPDVLHTRNGVTPRIDYKTFQDQLQQKKKEKAKELNQDTKLGCVSHFFTFVFSLVVLVLCWAFIQDFWPSHESVNPWVAKIMPIFEDPVDFTRFGSQSSNEITAQAIIAHLSQDVQPYAKKFDAMSIISQTILEIFNDNIGETYEAPQNVGVMGLEPFDDWNKLVFKVKEKECSGATEEDSSISTSDNNNENE